MGICWWCHWGWPKQIQDVYDRAVEKLGGYKGPLHWGPAHVVWEDENWDCAESCLDDFAELSASSEYSPEQLEIVKQPLVELIAVDEEYKTEPEEYENRDGLPEDRDRHPEDFPPPSHWIMVKKR